MAWEHDTRTRDANTHARAIAQSLGHTTERPDGWRDVWADDREANRIAARIAMAREDADDMAEFLARARAATS